MAPRLFFCSYNNTIPFIIFAFLGLLLSNSVILVLIVRRLFSPYPLRHVSYLSTARRIRHFLSSSTRVELCLTTHAIIGDLDSLLVTHFYNKTLLAEIRTNDINAAIIGNSLLTIVMSDYSSSGSRQGVDNRGATCRLI